MPAVPFEAAAIYRELKAELDEERDEILARWGKDNATIQRYKGLGEMNPAQLKETVMVVNPIREANGVVVLNEHLQRVIVSDAHHAGQVMSALMGKAVGPRKEWLIRAWAGEEGGGGGEDDDAEDSAED